MTIHTRRRILQSMLAAPALAGLTPALRAFADEDPLIDSAAKALDVFDFERLARAKLPPAHWGYLKTGVDGDATLHANDAGFANYGLRVRRMVDISRIDTSVNLFGTTWQSPIFLDPVGSQRAFHADGEIATAKAARSKKHLQILSTVSSTGIEDVNAARGEPVWYQLYPTDHWPVTQALVRRAEAAGCPVLVLTVDLQGGSNRVTLARTIPRDSRDCTACHTTGRTQLSGFIVGKPMFSGLDLSEVGSLEPADMTWDYLRRLRDIWPRKLVIKGLATREDALLAIEHGIDGIIVSNHGGRAEDSGRAAIDSLAEVAPAVPAACRCSWTAASAAAPTSSRPSRSAPTRSASAGPTSGAWRPSGRKASSACSRSCRRSSRATCARRGREASPRSTHPSSSTNGGREPWAGPGIRLRVGRRSCCSWPALPRPPSWRSRS